MAYLEQTPLDSALATPMYQQLYEYLRTGILTGQLGRGTKLPSTRALAETLGISRNTVLNAYEQLLAEGYLTGESGRGTFVTDTLPDALLRPRPTRTRAAQAATRSHRASEAAQTLLAEAAMPSSFQYRPFQGGIPALDAFPYDLWSRLVARHAARLYPEKLMYQASAGYQPLREAIANHVILARQVRCTPEQVIVVNGSQEALYLAARALLNPGDRVWIEDPGYLGARNALRATGAALTPVPVDEQGLQVEAGIERAARARMAYVTPSHQFPLGVTLSLARRLALLEWAQREGAYILEDDYDSEYHYATRPLASLQGLDRSETVIYIGTFSKVLFPALRVGYVIVPEPLIKTFTAMRRAMAYHAPLLEQAALADFISEGHFVRHIRRMRALYAQRQAALLAAGERYGLDVAPQAGGISLVAWLPAGVDDQAAAARAAEHRVSALPISMLSMEARLRGGLALGYAGFNEREIESAAQRLAAALNSLV